MGKSVYTGFPNGLTVRGVPILNTYPNNVFWVHSGTGSDGNPGTERRPFATIDYAIGKCTASKGDLILVKAGHAETLDGASDITFDVAGVTCIGLGTGDNRPILTFASTDNSASIVVSADDVTIANIIGLCGDDGLTSAINVTGDDVTLDIEWHDGSATVEAATVVTATTVTNFNCKLRYVGFVTGNACVSPIILTAVTGARIDVDFYGQASTAVVEMLTTASTDVLVTGYFYNDNVALTKNVVNTGGLACTWWAQGYDGKGGYSFSGGSAAALAADDVATVATYASQASSYGVSVGLQGTSIISQCTSIGIGTSTTTGLVVSAGLAVQSVISQATSIGIGTSTTTGKVESTALAVQSIISQATSIGIGTSVTTGKTESLATALTSALTSIGLVISSIENQVT